MPFSAACDCAWIRPSWCSIEACDPGPAIPVLQHQLPGI